MIDPPAAAAELRRAVTELGLVGMVTPQQIRDKNLSDPSFDVVWAEAERLDATVCVHGGGQAPDQLPIGVDRYNTRLEVHALTHPIGNMLALMSMIIGGVIHRFPKLRVGFMKSGCGWLPFWLERLDEHYELMPEQAPGIDRKPSEYFLDGQLLHLLRARRAHAPAGRRAARRQTDRLRLRLLPLGLRFPDTVKLIAERNDVSDTTKKRIFHENPAQLYALS